MWVKWANFMGSASHVRLACRPRKRVRSFFHVSAKQVGVHDPTVLGSCLGTDSLDVIRNVGQPARDQNFVLRAQIGTPIYVNVRSVDLLEGLLSVEQDHHAVGIDRKSLAQLSAGREADGLADPIERDPVPRRQRLDAADAGDHFVFECNTTPGLNPVDDPQGAVIERGVAPDEKRAAFAVAKFLRQKRLVDPLNARMPVLNTPLVIGRIPGTLRCLEIDKAIVSVFDESLAYFQPKALKVLLFQSLARDEEHVCLIERVDRLNGYVVRVSSADAYDENFSHRVTLFCISTWHEAKYETVQWCLGGTPTEVLTLGYYDTIPSVEMPPILAPILAPPGKWRGAMMHHDTA